MRADDFQRANNDARISFSFGEGGEGGRTSKLGFQRVGDKGETELKLALKSF